MSDILKTLAISNIVDDNDSVGVSIVAVGDCSESLLASGVPLSCKIKYEHQLGFLTIARNDLGFLN